MPDVTCPYCRTEQEINHDDGYGYDEHEEYEQQCIHCKQIFFFTIAISFSYEVYCQDGDHIMQPFGDQWPDMYECAKCDFYEKRKL